MQFVQLTKRLALWTFQRRMLMAAQIACLCLIFAPYGDQLSRFVGLPFLLLLAGFGLLSPGRQSVVYSNVLLACFVYLAAMTLASLIAADAPQADVWRQFRISVLIVAFLATTGSLVAAFPAFLRVLFPIVGTVGALSAAINIFLFYEYMVPASSSLLDFRLIASIGMPDYANSTNISATYAVLFVGVVCTILRTRPAVWLRAILAVDATILATGMLLTQARSAWLGSFVGLAILALTGSRRTRVAGIAMLLAAIVISLANPVLREALMARGSSSRFEVWSKFIGLIAARPLVGYGSFSPVGIIAAGYYFLDQAHNLVLSAWFRGGIASAFAMMYILFGGTYWSYRYWALTGEVIPLCVMTTIVSAGMLDYQLLATYPAWPWVTFWLPFGLSIGAEMAWRIKTRQLLRDPPVSCDVVR